MRHPGAICLTPHQISSFFGAAGLAQDLVAHPGPGISPVAVSGCPRQPQRLGRLLHAQPGEVPQLHQLSRLAILGCQTGQRLIDGQDLMRPCVDREVGLEQVDAHTFAAMLLTPALPCVLDQDASHGLGGGGKEVAAAVPALDSILVDQPEVRLVNQGRGLERLPGQLAAIFPAASLRSSS